MTSLPLSQDPHRTRDQPEQNLELAIGRELRSFRHQQGLTVAELSHQTGVSLGMLSKIENGNTSPSLTTLKSLAQALNVPMTAFFRRFEEYRPVVHTRGGGMALKPSVKVRVQATITICLGIWEQRRNGGVTVEPYLITLSEESDRFPTFQHEGTEFIFMLEGEVEYRPWQPGFCTEAGRYVCFLMADAPHGPEELTSLPARYLSVISYPQSG